MTYTLKIPSQVTPCYSSDPAERRELTALFDSTDLFDHRQAAKLCRECPFVQGCGELALELSRQPHARFASAPAGTWAGVLFRRGRPVVKR